MPSGEIGILSLLKFLWVLLSVPIGWLWAKMLHQDKKLENVYTKQETHQLMDLIIGPIKETSERLIMTNKELIIELREMNKELNQVKIGLASLDERYRK